MAGPNYEENDEIGYATDADLEDMDRLPTDSVMQYEDLDEDTENAVSFTENDPNVTPEDRAINETLQDAAIGGTNWPETRTALEGTPPEGMDTLDGPPVPSSAPDVSRFEANDEIGNIVEPAPRASKDQGYKPPSLKAYMEYQTGNAVDAAPAAATRFPEESDPSLSQALDKADPLRRQVDIIGKLSPEERANTGALIGARAGATFMGRAGATIGGKIGAFAGRGAGVARSGELAKQNRDNRIWNSMKTMGVVAPDGKVKFDDSTVTLPSEAVGRLPNLKTNPLNGQKDRTLYETDSTNPLTQRALLAAKPLAMYYANGMLGYKDKKNPVDAEAAKAASAMYANMFTEGVSNAESVYSRARQTAKKMGLKEKQVRGYFSTISANLSFDEAQDIKKGLDIIFAK